MISLVLGGARSGKSAVAEACAARLPGPVTYLATGVVTDDDMAARIAAHRARRPASWATVEVTGDLAGTLLRIPGPVLLDALGTWVAHDLDRIDIAALDEVCLAVARRNGDTVVVSEEVGLGVHPSSEVGRRFRDVLGHLNQRMAAQADEVLLVVAGRVLPLAPFGGPPLAEDR